MDIEGKIIMDLGLQQGTSKAGRPWKKREMVLETFDVYPKKVKFHIFGDRVDTINLEPGKDYILSIDIESREFNGRWYTDVNVYRAQPSQGRPMNNAADNNYNTNSGYPVPDSAHAPFGQSGETGFPPFESGLGMEGNSEEDLPF